MLKGGFWGWLSETMPQFARYIGIDYSGAETADSSCKGSE
jgi:hypothetical protein